jgi:two-component system sensor kinase FixL
MNLSVRAKAVIYTVCIVCITSIISTIGVSWLIVRQTHQQNQKRLHAALASFERTFVEVPKTLERQFNTFLNLKSLAVQMLETIRSGWTLEVGLDYVEHFSKFEELFVSNEAIERFALYIAPKFQGEERLTLYFDQALGDLILVEDDQHIRRREFDRTAIENPQIFPLIYTSSQQYALHMKHGKMYLIAHLEYVVDPFDMGQSIHLGTFVFEKALQLDLPDLEQEMQVMLNLYDETGTMGAGTVSMPDLNLAQTVFSKEHTVVQLTDTHGQGYDSLLVPLTYGNLILGYAAVSISHAETTHNIQETVILLLIVTVSIILVVFFISSILITTWSRPIIKLTNASLNIAKGALDQEIDTSGTDELGTLARSFAHMRDEIKREIADLHNEIAERKRAEEALRESEERYRTLFNQAGVSIVLIDLDTGQKVHFNQYAHEHLGYMAEEFAALQIAEIEMEPAEQTMEHLKQLQTAGHVRFETKHRTKQGELRDMLINAKVIAYYGKHVIQGIGYDITDLKQAEDAIRKLNTELEQRVHDRTAELEAANKELQSFAYVVSHDLKAPLRGISQLANWLVTDYAAAFDEQGKEMVSLLLGRVKRLDNLIEGILQYSRIGRVFGENVSIDLNTLVQEVIDTLAPPAHVHILVADSLPTIIGDRTRIQQVFQNLIENAVKFLDKPEGRVTIGCRDEGTYWTFSVADNGPGIDPKYHEKIFQIFQTLASRDERESTGIGLAIVKKIVEELYQGKIWVESTQGEGSTFLFTWPKTKQ